MSETISVIAQISIKNDYLFIVPIYPSGRKTVMRDAAARQEDLLIQFWGKEQIRKVCDLLKLSAKERMGLYRGDSIARYVKRSLLTIWVEEQKDQRQHREQVIEKLELVSKALHKLFLRDKRLHKKALEHVKSGILPFMDGSTTLWLSVIISSKKDFLRLHGDPRRILEWEHLELEDLIEEDGTVKRGLDDAWQYFTSKGFLLDDEYLVDIGNPEEDTQKPVNLEQLLSWLIETCRGRSLDSSIVDPSIEHLRSELAKDSGDPKLIAIYCKTKE
jgi:hypothetical protein